MLPLGMPAERGAPPAWVRWVFEVGSTVGGRYEVGFRKKEGLRVTRNPSVFLIFL
jgi:hypothetical protein